MYAIMYQESEEQFEVIEGSESNLSKSDSVIVTDDRALLEEFMHAYNNWLWKGQAEIKTCPQCGKFFILGRAERGWFEAYGLQIPKRCHSCRNTNHQEGPLAL